MKRSIGSGGFLMHRTCDISKQRPLHLVTKLGRFSGTTTHLRVLLGHIGCKRSDQGVYQIEGHFSSRTRGPSQHFDHIAYSTHESNQGDLPRSLQYQSADPPVLHAPATNIITSTFIIYHLDEIREAAILRWSPSAFIERKLVSETCTYKTA